MSPKVPILTVIALLAVARSSAGWPANAESSVFDLTRATRNRFFVGESGIFWLPNAQGTAVVAGRVTDTLGVGLAGAKVSAYFNQMLFAQTTTDPGGNYSLSSLPAGRFEVWAQKTNYGSRPAYGINLVNGQTVVRNFALSPAPGQAVVVATNRSLEPLNLVKINGVQLKVFSVDRFVTNGTIDPTKPVVVMTHGWNSDPQAWGTNMAAKIADSVAGANLLAWDWHERAHTKAELGLALSRTPNEGEKLGQALAQALEGQAATPVHFIGHSLGTLVNACAADYLIGKASPAFGTHRIQMTLLDDAGLANVGGRIITLAYTIPLSQNILTANYASQRNSEVFSVGWVDPIPNACAWIDNYMSLVGNYHPQAVNLWLPKSAVTTLSEAHSYACRWYALTAQNPANSILGNRYSFERLGGPAQFPSPSPYGLGSLYEQVPLQADELAVAEVQDLDNYIAERSAVLIASGLLDAANTLATWGQKVGDTVVDVAENVIPDGIGGWGGVISAPIFSLRVTLTSATVAPSSAASRETQDAGGDLSVGPAVWLPIQVPTNAALFAFDFKLSGVGVEDLLSASIGGTNVFALETRYMPVNQSLNSGPIDVSRWAGQTVEFFFGLLGGTSTNATMIVEGLRFYQIDPPLLTANKLGTNLIVSWPATAVGFTLETSSALKNSTWTTLTNTPTLSGMREYVTNSVADGSRFYRLKRN